MTARPYLISFFVVFLIVSLAIPCFGAADNPNIKYGEPKQISKLKDSRINESSGIAVSWRNKDAFWTHNDSGDSPRIFLFNTNGETLAVVNIKGATAVDWEDIASFKFGKECYILVADVGDNNKIRKVCTLYLIREPVIGMRDEIKEALDADIEPALTINFNYEDGAHDCEGVAVDPTDGTIYLISKEFVNKCKVYSISIPKKETKEPITAKAIASLRLPNATGMDISPDGMRAVVLTYGDAYEFLRNKDETWAQAFLRTPRKIKMPPRRQGESICYGTDGQTLYLTSEYESQPLWEVPVIKRNK